MTPAYSIVDVAKDGGSGICYGYSHHGGSATLLAKGLSLVQPNKVFAVQHENVVVQRWANGSQLAVR
jgi:hypothetical protein